MSRMAVRKACGHACGLPRGCFDQACARISAPISPPPDRKEFSAIGLFFTFDRANNVQTGPCCPRTGKLSTSPHTRLVLSGYAHASRATLNRSMGSAMAASGFLAFFVAGILFQRLVHERDYQQVTRRQPYCGRIRAKVFPCRTEIAMKRNRCDSRRQGCHAQATR